MRKIARSNENWTNILCIQHPALKAHSEALMKSYRQKCQFQKSSVTSSIIQKKHRPISRASVISSSCGSARASVGSSASPMTCESPQVRTTAVTPSSPLTLRSPLTIMRSPLTIRSPLCVELPLVREEEYPVGDMTKPQQQSQGVIVTPPAISQTGPVLPVYNTKPDCRSIGTRFAFPNQVVQPPVSVNTFAAMPSPPHSHPLTPIPFGLPGSHLQQSVDPLVVSLFLERMRQVEQVQLQRKLLAMKYGSAAYSSTI